MTWTRQEHLDWCKARALEYVECATDCKSLQLAMTSMASDLNKHPDTQGHAAVKLGYELLFAGLLDNPEDMRTFITGVR
jgi:hypothetical protein